MQSIDASEGPQPGKHTWFRGATLRTYEAKALGALLWTTLVLCANSLGKDGQQQQSPTNGDLCVCLKHSRGADRLRQLTYSSRSNLAEVTKAEQALTVEYERPCTSRIPRRRSAPTTS
ncbi:hypothetical protein ABZW03_24780 [Kitasatospora sp. NPDC004799]|uniref:hypothetical protein n=1 Tax=Kitasatospora sp. NPDC004799 TaxID=3154460 RepID=UPI0033A490B3